MCKNPKLYPVTRPPKRKHASSKLAGRSPCSTSTRRVGEFLLGLRLDPLFSARVISAKSLRRLSLWPGPPSWLEAQSESRALLLWTCTDTNGSVFRRRAMASWSRSRMSRSPCTEDLSYPRCRQCIVNQLRRQGQSLAACLPARFQSRPLGTGLARCVL